MEEEGLTGSNEGRDGLGPCSPPRRIGIQTQEVEEGMDDDGGLLA